MENTITLTALQKMISKALAQSVADSYWVVAEVSECKVNYSGHCYMELVERAADGKAPVAQARAVVWSSNYKMMSAYFRSQTGSEITAGMKLLVRCSVSYHAVYGLSLTISDIDPTYTIGETERLRRETITRLQNEGILDMNSQCPMAQLPQRLAVISSAQAAGYQDFMNELRAYPYRFETELFAAVMQGDGAEASVVAAFEAIAQRDEEFDAVVLIRGGGSVSDLACFDSYMLCSYLAQMPLPVITGIGHDKDVSVADMVAHLSLKTPTAVAAYLVGEAHAIAVRLDELQARVMSDSRSVMIACDRRLEQLSMALVARSRDRLTAGIAAMDGYSQRLINGVSNVFERQRSRLDLLESAIEGASPQRILARGYAIVRGVGGTALSSVTELEPGEQLSIELKDGTMKATVNDK